MRRMTSIHLLIVVVHVFRFLLSSLLSLCLSLSLSSLLSLFCAADDAYCFLRASHLDGVCISVIASLCSLPSSLPGANPFLYHPALLGPNHLSSHCSLLSSLFSNLLPSLCFLVYQECEPKWPRCCFSCCCCCPRCSISCRWRRSRGMSVCDLMYKEASAFI